MLQLVPLVHETLRGKNDWEGKTRVDNRQRRLVAAVVLALSVLIVIYLIFFTPSETTITTSTPIPTSSNASGPIWTQLPSTPESDVKRTAEAEAAQSELTLIPDDQATVDSARAMTEMPQWMGRVASNPENSICPGTAVRTVNVANGAELTQALESAQPGDRISLAPGNYAGNFVLASSGEQSSPIWICGSREAVIDSGGLSNGVGLSISGNYAGVWGLTVSNAQTGILVDGGDFVTIDYVEIRTTGNEGINFRNNATDGIVQDALVHHTGLQSATSGVGISVGSSAANWTAITGGDPDKSDRIAILRNWIWDTAAESIDLKEGTSDGRIEFNSFDGSSITGANSWVDVKGNGYMLQGNVGTTSPEDGFQTHSVGDLGWGTDNTFVANTAQVSGPGYGFYIQDSETTNNVVSCSNFATAAEAGFSNVACSDVA